MFAVVSSPQLSSAHSFPTSTLISQTPCLHQTLSWVHSHHQACLCPQVSEGDIPRETRNRGAGEQREKVTHPIQKRDSDTAAEKGQPWRMDRGGDLQGKIRGHGGLCSLCIWDQRGFQEAGVSGWGHGKDARLEIEFGASFQEPLNVELRSLVFYARQRGAARGCT